MSGHTLALFIWLVSSIWSGATLLSKLWYKDSVSVVNLLWFAVSVGLFIWEKGLLK